MAEWTMMGWQATAEAVANGLRQYAWRGPGEGLSEAPDPRLAASSHP